MLIYTSENMNLSIIEFCEINEIKWQPIELHIENGEKELKICKCTDKYSYMPKPTDFTDKPLSEKKLKHRQKYLYKFEYIAIDTSNYYQIDVDNGEYLDKVKNIMDETPYFLSSSKNLPHLIFKSNIKYEKKRVSTIYKYKDKNGNIKDAIEILAGQWSYVNKNAIVYNSNKDIKCIELDFIFTKNEINKNTKKINSEIINNTNIEPNDNLPFRRLNDSGVSHPVMQIITERSEKPMVFEPLNYNDEKYNFIEKLGECYNKDRLDLYVNWIELLFAYKNELGERGKKMFDKLSSKSKKYNQIENEKIWNMTEIKTQGKRKTIKIKRSKR